MSSSAHPPTLAPFSLQEMESIRAQMERLLRSSHFRNSRRYPALLRYVVEETLEGRGPQLKERTLGVEVFGRTPDYDTASDPIVRVTIAEIRKRIAQYYHEDAHASELRIELNPGSYIPEFLFDREIDPEVSTQPAEEAASPLEASTASPLKLPLPFLTPYRWKVYGIAATLLVLSAIALPMWGWLRISPMDRLWSPVFAGSTGPITFCIPMSVRKNGIGKAWTTDEAIAHVLDLADTKVPASGTFFDHELIGENVVYSDVLAMMKMESVVEPQKRPVRVRLNLGANLNDLREGPDIFLGGLDNQWTLKLLVPLRYRFAGSDADSYYILDANAPGNRQWAIRLTDKITAVQHDYALIARIHSQELGQIVMIAAGIGMSGTAAAGEFLSDPAQVRELERRIGYANRNRDFEAVLKTDVDNGIAGAAQIVAIDLR